MLVSLVHKNVLRRISSIITRRKNITTKTSEAVTESWENAKPYEEVPGPKPSPIIGNTWRFIPGIGERGMLSAYTMYKKYGDTSKITGIPGRRDMVILCDPDGIEKVFRNEGPTPIRFTAQCFIHYRNVTRKELFHSQGSLISLQGEEWQKLRSKANPIIMQPRSSRLYMHPIDTVALDFVKRMRNLRDANEELPADFSNEFFKWSLESISYIVLDTRLGCLDSNLKPDSEAQKMIDSIKFQFDYMYELDTNIPLWKFISTPSWRTFVRTSDYFYEVSQKYINQAIERLKIDPPDGRRELTTLEKMLTRDPNPMPAIVMALDMIITGTDTTAFSAMNALYYLSKNQEKQQKLYEEIRSLLPQKEDPITADKLNEMKYLKACMKETLRLSPTAPIQQRVLPKDLILCNYIIPKGTSILMPLNILSNNEKYYPEANKYIPERWIEDGFKFGKKPHPFTYLPFGYGPRMCIGRRFSEMEVQTLIAKIIRNFRVEYNYKMKFDKSFFIHPASPLKFRLVDRVD